MASLMDDMRQEIFLNLISERNSIASSKNLSSKRFVKHQSERHLKTKKEKASPSVDDFNPIVATKPQIPPQAGSNTL